MADAPNHETNKSPPPNLHRGESPHQDHHLNATTNDKSTCRSAPPQANASNACDKNHTPHSKKPGSCSEADGKPAYAKHDPGRFEKGYENLPPHDIPTPSRYRRPDRNCSAPRRGSKIVTFFKNTIAFIQNSPLPISTILPRRDDPKKLLSPRELSSQRRP